MYVVVYYFIIPIMLLLLIIWNNIASGMFLQKKGMTIFKCGELLGISKPTVWVDKLCFLSILCIPWVPEVIFFRSDRGGKLRGEAAATTPRRKNNRSRRTNTEPHFRAML